MKLSKTQQLIIDLALQRWPEHGGIFIPFDKRVWHSRSHEFVTIGGSGQASAIRSLKAQGIVESLRDHDKYSFRVVDPLKFTRWDRNDKEVN
jgi:hypothetical protein